MVNLEVSENEKMDCFNRIYPIYDILLENNYFFKEFMLHSAEQIGNDLNKSAKNEIILKKRK